MGRFRFPGTFALRTRPEDMFLVLVVLRGIALGGGPALRLRFVTLQSAEYLFHECGLLDGVKLVRLQAPEYVRLMLGHY
jgi:hypothetical protein